VIQYTIASICYNAKLARIAENMRNNQELALRNGPNDRSDANPDDRKGDDEIADTSER